jgi:hypothetical protein
VIRQQSLPTDEPPWVRRVLYWRPLGYPLELATLGLIELGVHVASLADHWSSRWTPPERPNGPPTSTPATR